MEAEHSIKQSLYKSCKDKLKSYQAAKPKTFYGSEGTEDFYQGFDVVWSLNNQIPDVIQKTSPTAKVTQH